MFGSVARPVVVWVVADEIDADGGDLGGVVSARELRFAALQGLAEEVLRIVDRGRERDDEARLLRRRLVLALKRLPGLLRAASSL